MPTPDTHHHAPKVMGVGGTLRCNFKLQAWTEQWVFRWLASLACPRGMIYKVKSQVRFYRLMIRFMVSLVFGWMGCVALAQPVVMDVKEDSSAVEEPGDVLDPTWGVGSWIWSPDVFDKQTCRLWRSFEIPSGATVVKAQLHIGVDNGYRLKLDGRELGTGSDWRSITEYEIGLLLYPGPHVLAVEAFNDNREAGMLLGLRIELADGKLIMISSNESWRIVPSDELGWERKLEAPKYWKRSVIVSAFLPRNGLWQERRPTMTVRIPLLRPVDLHFWQRGWFQVALWFVIIVTVLLCLRLMAQVVVHSKANSLLNIERARIARDIHDELGARLTELALEGEVIRTELPVGSKVLPKLGALCEKAREVSGAMDEVVWMVNSRRDTLSDFTSYACKHAQRFLALSAISCRLDVDGDLPDAVFELPIRRNLLLCVKEALNNAVKYSKAGEVFLRIHAYGQSLLVVVEDDGAGFDLELADSVRNGLTNMSERMKEIGGRCEISTKPGSGCRVEFQVPIRQSSKRAIPLGGGRGLSIDHLSLVSKSAEGGKG